MHSIMSVKQTSRPRPSTRSSMAVVSQENLMHANFLNCAIAEEDILDNIEPNLVSSALTDSSSSHFSSDFRSYGDRFEVSAADPNNAPLFDQSSHEAQEPKDYNNLVPVNDTHHPVDPFDEPMCSHQSRSKLSLSMHDLSKIPSFPLESKQSNFSSETIQSQSITTVGSCPKSKDSGFPRSLSCLSLNSGRSYEHVQSKVKEYIKQIKAGNTTKRKLTYESPTYEKTCCEVGGKIYEESTPPRILVPIINKLKDELEEKDRMLLTLQENYDALLMKYAAAENRVDHFRVNLVRNSFDITITDYKKPKASPNVLLLPNLCGLQKESNYLDFGPEPPNKPNPVGLRPLTNSSSLVDGLEEAIEPRLQHSPFSSTIISKEKNGRYSFHLNRETNCESELVESESRPSGNAAVPESPHENRMTTPDNSNRTRPLNHQVENPFVKVKRWQESLPSMHLFEPGVYDQFPGSDSGSELFSQKKNDKAGWSLTEIDGVSLITSNVNEPPAESRVTDMHFEEVKPVNVQLDVVGEGESLKSDLSDPHPPLSCTSPSNVSLMHDTDAGLDPLKNLSDDLSCHASHRKYTKNVCHTDNTNSVPTYGDSSSTFHCLENANNQSISGQECTHESSSVATSPLCNERDIANQSQSTNVCSMSPAQNKPYISLVAQANDNTQNSLAQNHLPPIIAPLLHKSHLPSLPKIQPITKQLFSSAPSNSTLSFVNLTKEIGETNSLCRKRLLGRKARLLMMEYLQNSDSTCNCCTKDNSNHVACSCYTVPNDSQIRNERRDSFEDKNVILAQCLDEMNECAEKVRGKSEAIMEVLSKQLRES